MHATAHLSPCMDTARLPAPHYLLARTLARAFQVVAGTNYFFKVQVADAEFVQLRVFLSLFGDAPQLVALRKGEEAAGPLQYFEVAE